MSTQELETSSLVVYGELQRAKDITDKALVIEKEIGTEVIYTLISLQTHGRHCRFVGFI